MIRRDLALERGYLVTEDEVPRREHALHRCIDLGLQRGVLRRQIREPDPHNDPSSFGVT